MARVFQKALVTGASKGLGKEITLELIRTNKVKNLALLARDITALNTLKEDILKNHQFQGHIELIPMDLGASDLMSKLSDLPNDIDLLINNAGCGSVNEFEHTRAQDIHQMVMVNNYSLTLLSHHYAKIMLQKNGGEIINVASVAGYMPIPLFSVYAATKAYVIYLTHGLDGELASKGVRVKAFCPGGMETDFNRTAGLSEKALQDNRHFMESAVRSAKDVMTLIDSSHVTYVPRFYNKFFAYSTRFMPKKLQAMSSRSIYRKQLEMSKKVSK